MIEIQQESLESIYEEFSALLKEHWQEFHGCDPEFNRESYLTMEKASILQLVTVRDSRSLVGYHISVIIPYIHLMSTVGCFTDVYYIMPTYRGRGIGRQMFNYVDTINQKRGVDFCRTGHRLSQPHDKLFASIGYSPIEVTYEKVYVQSK